MKGKKSLIQDRIGELISVLGMNKRSFAKKVGTTDTSIGNIVAGRNNGLPKINGRKPVKQQNRPESVEFLN